MPAYGQTSEKKPAPAAKPADASAELMRSNTILAALLKKDAATFGKHFDDDAVLTTPDGAVQTKAQLLGDVKSGALVLEASTISDMKVKVHGDAAVVTYIIDRQRQVQRAGHQRPLPLDRRLRASGRRLAARRWSGHAYPGTGEVGDPLSGNRGAELSGVFATPAFQARMARVARASARGAEEPLTG